MKAKFHYRQSWRNRLIGTLLIPLQFLVGVPLSVMASTSDSSTHHVKNASASYTKVNRETRDTSTFVPVFNLPDNPTDLEIRKARVFPVPLIPTSDEAVTGENQALATALQTFHKRTDVEDVSSIKAFLQQYPKSRWRADLQFNIGTLQYETGYLIEAISDWRDAWNLTKSAKSGELKALADSAFGRLSVLDAELGRTQALKGLFAETAGRGFYGSAAQQVRAAKSGYRTMQLHPSIAFKCGPFALDSIRTANENVHKRSGVVQSAASTPNGTSLEMVQKWADKLNLNYQMAKRSPGAQIIVPAVMHWKVGHFGALVRFKNGKFLVQDPTFAGQEIWLSPKAIDHETSGYFLIPAGTLPAGWTPVSAEEAADVWGRGGAENQDENSITKNDVKCGCGGSKSPMTSPSTFAMLASLYLEDTPVRYSVPVGPNPNLEVNYTSENGTPLLYSYSNFGYDWSFQYISYIAVDPSQNVTVTLPGGGTEVAEYSAFDDVNNVYPPDIKSQAQIYLDSPGVYDRHLPDGTRQVYSQPDGTGRIFLKQIFDPQGNSLILNYDSNFRLTSIVDQLGQATTFTYLSNTYGNVGFYKIITITDPFGRSASFQYDSATTTELVQITDVLGISSQFTYDVNYFIDSLTTPYGKTLFYNYVPTSDADAENGLRITWPDGTQSITESYAGHELNTYYWDRRQSPSYPSKSDAMVYHWDLNANSRTESGILNYTRQPLEGGSITWPYGGLGNFPPGAVVYNYPGGYNVPVPDGPPPPAEEDFTHYYTGISNLPSEISRQIDSSGDFQSYLYSYNPIGHVTQSVDPLGRSLSYSYASNNIDVLQVRQTRGTSNDLLARYTYNSQHEPLTYQDGSGQTTTYTYNTAGQIATIVQPSPGGTTTFNYNSNHYLTSIDGPLAGSNDVTTFTYDGYGRIHTVSDSEGYTLTFSYDNYDRPTTVTYPDGTYEQTTWNLLDPVLLRDRLGNWTRQQFDSLRQLIAVTDPLGHTTKYSWCTCGGLATITDPSGNVTTWARDLQGRPTTKTYQNGSTLTYGYDFYTSRLTSVQDALGQTKNYTYNIDDSLSGVSYGSPVNPTFSVTYAYDPNYPRLTSVANGWGTIDYIYNPYISDPYGATTTGAGKVSQVANLPSGGSPVNITYAYDALGRVTNRSINGTANASSWSYDAMNRVTSIVNPLGTFTPAYVDQGASGGDKGTTRLASMTYPNGQVTNYSYFSTTNDERLQQINNLNSASSVISQFNYTYDAKGQILSWKQQADSNAATRYDTGYDPAGQLLAAVKKTDSTNAVLHQYYYNYDAAGNRISEQVDAGVTQTSVNNLNQITSQSAGGATLFQGTISQPGTVTVNGQPAAMTPTATNFVANPMLSSGTNTVTVIATNGNGAAQTNQYQVVVPAETGVSPTYDADGNMTNNGNGQTYAWDAENRLYQITQGGNTYQFTYDGLGRRVSETDNGTLVKQWVWVGDTMAEERNGSGTVTKRFYAQGEQIAGTSYYYTRDHLGSVREMMASDGATIAARYDYDPYGRATLLSGSSSSDFQYAGYYEHAASGLNLTLFRAYDPNTARWLSRDPAEEDASVNLYAYVDNSPVDLLDPLGLWQTNINIVIPLTPVGAGIGINLTFGHNSGQWNAGYMTGPGEGLLFSAKTNFKNSGCEQKGLHLDMGANIGAGFVEGLSGSGKISFGSGFQTVSMGGSVTGAGPLGGATVNYGTGTLGVGFPAVGTPTPTVSATVGGSLGAGGFFGGGGHLTW